MNSIIKIYNQIMTESYESMSKREIGKNEDYEVILGGFNDGVVTVEKSTRKGKEHSHFPALSRSTTYSTFRYVPKFKTIFWWNHEDSVNDVRKDKAENALRRLGYKVEKHDSIYAPKYMNIRDRDNYRHRGISITHDLNKQSYNFNKWEESVKVSLKDRDIVDKKTLKKGTKVEKEHTPSKKKAETIALQHIKEFPKIKNGKMDSDYYKELDKMEKKLGKNE